MNDRSLQSKNNDKNILKFKQDLNINAMQNTPYDATIASIQHAPSAPPYSNQDTKKYIKQHIFIKKKNRRDVMSGTVEKTSKISQQIMIRKDNIKTKIEPNIIKKRKR